MSDAKTGLMRGALETLRTRGTSGASARDIAAAAGVGQAPVLRRFDGVNGLLTALLRR